MDKIQKYCRDSLTADLQRIIGKYEEFAGINAFFNLSQRPRFFYEWSIQGMIYELLSAFVGGHYSKYLLLLEQPYDGGDIDHRSDIMYVNLEDETIHSIELKTNYKEQSAIDDMSKLVAQIKSGNIATGIAVFMAKAEADASRWIDAAANSSRDIKDAIHSKQLQPVGVPWNLE